MDITELHLKLNPDHLKTLTRVRPEKGITELVANAFDADADTVSVYFVFGRMGAIEQVVVEDDGHGFTDVDMAAFGGLGGSWKVEAKFSRKKKRQIRGLSGQGRFCAFSLGSHIEWDTRSDERGEPRSRAILIKDTNLLVAALRSTERASTGTTVTISNLLLEPPIEKIRLALISKFAQYLRHHPRTKILFGGKLLDTETAISRRDPITVELPDGTRGNIEVVEWKDRSIDRAVNICDGSGNVVEELSPKFRTPGFKFTAYVQADSLALLAADHALDLSDINPKTGVFVEAVENALKRHFKDRQRSRAEEYVETWIAEGSYPYEGEPINKIEETERYVWGVCAANMAEEIDGFDRTAITLRKFQFRLLRAAIERSPSDVHKIFESVFKLSKEKQHEFAELLDRAELNHIIEMTRAVVDRLAKLKELREILEDRELRKGTREKADLHPFLEDCPWLFGDRYLMTVSESSIAKVLRELRPKHGREWTDASSSPDERKRLDLLLSRSMKLGSGSGHEYLVVEIKRPSIDVSLKVIHQIQEYAAAITRDGRFKGSETRWRFVCVGREIAKDAYDATNQHNRQKGLVLDTENYQIFAYRWSELIDDASARLEFVREKLPLGGESFAEGIRGRVLEIRERSDAKKARRVPTKRAAADASTADTTTIEPMDIASGPSETPVKPTE